MTIGKYYNELSDHLAYNNTIIFNSGSHSCDDHDDIDIEEDIWITELRDDYYKSLL